MAIKMFDYQRRNSFRAPRGTLKWSNDRVNSYNVAEHPGVLNDVIRQHCQLFPNVVAVTQCCVLSNRENWAMQLRALISRSEKAPPTVGGFLDFFLPFLPPLRRAVMIAAVSLLCIDCLIFTLFCIALS